MAPLCYRRLRFPPEIIQHAIWSHRWHFAQQWQAQSVKARLASRKFRFARDSPLEGDGFELPVPGFRSSIFYTAPELGAAKGPGATAGFEDRQREVYRAPSQAGPGNDIHAGFSACGRSPK